MRRYLSVLLVLVTFLVAGCAGDGGSQRTMRTPSGGVVNEQLPEFSPLADRSTARLNPLPTVTNGKANVTPYYKDSKADLPPVKIGLIVPLSGPQGALGQAMLNAAQLAVFDLGASNITIVPSDTTQGAARAANEVLGQGAQIILGPLFAQDVKTVTPIARAKNVPVLAFSTDWTAASDNTYIMGFLPFGQVSRVVDFAAKRGAKNFGALIPETPYGVAVNSTLRNELSRQGLDAPHSAVFDSNMMPAAVQELARSPIDTMLVPVGGEQLDQVSLLLSRNNINTNQTKLIGTGLWDSSPQAAKFLPGSWFASPDPKLRVSFTRQYQETYGSAPPRLATLAYDATALSAALAIKGIKETGKPAYSRSDLTNPAGFAGLDGVFRFRPDGLAERGLAILELRPGGPVVIDPAPTRF